MCHSSGLSTFALTCIEHLSDLAVPELIIVDPSEPKRSDWKRKLKKAVRLDGNLWHIQSRLFPMAAIPAYRIKPLSECLPGAPRIECAAIRKGKWSEYFSPADVARIREYQLDFVLKFGYGIIRGGIFSVARYGVWSYHHGNEEKYRGGPPAFWEIYHRDPVTGALLQRINDTLDGGIVLKKISVPTESLSLAANLQRILESSAHMVRWVCLDLLHGNAQYLDAAPSKTQAPVYRAPNDPQMLRFWFRLAANWLGYKLANQRVDRWNVGLVRATPEEFLKSDFQPRVEWSAYNEKDQMIADPCLMHGTDGPRILCEEFDFLSEKGRIIEIRPASDGSLSMGAAAIEEDVHMSYPYVFEHQGETYCIPESADRGDAVLYRLDRGTGRWLRDTVLLEGVGALDTTVFQAHGAWWLMHSQVPKSDAGPWSLYLRRADDLRGPWVPHAGNPVKTDVGSSRPAGRPFWHEGALYRPAQDCGVSYGGALVINRVDSLSLEEFREVTVRRLAPDASWPYPDGIHTLNGLNGVCVIDAKRHTWPLGLILKRFLYKGLGKPRPRAFRYTGAFRFEPDGFPSKPAAGSR